MGAGVAQGQGGLADAAEAVQGARLRDDALAAGQGVADALQVAAAADEDVGRALRQVVEAGRRGMRAAAATASGGRPVRCSLWGLPPESAAAWTLRGVAASSSGRRPDSRRCGPPGP
ncbi:hypothetical protein [Streptomyces sp. RFCAC02]|uniref:hypothetical protein n=1 Tax=Streptomyces sp. RFCAC02 TaxID=2499143 RepID=UPI0010229D48|nr:hypothetical protein [Streptomyces sp. RFCAC02]